MSKRHQPDGPHTQNTKSFSPLRGEYFRTGHGFADVTHGLEFGVRLFMKLNGKGVDADSDAEHTE